MNQIAYCADASPRGHWAVIEAFSPERDPAGTALSVLVKIDGPGGFLLESIVTEGSVGYYGPYTPEASNYGPVGRVQITDMAGDKPLFSAPVQVGLFAARGAPLDATEISEDTNGIDFAGRVGADLCKLPVPRYFAPESVIHVSRDNIGDDASTRPHRAPRVFLCGWRYASAAESPALPPPGVEPYVYVARIHAKGARYSAATAVQIKTAQDFVATQIAVGANLLVTGTWGAGGGSPGLDWAILSNESALRLQIQDSSKPTPVFRAGPVTAALFGTHAGRRHRLPRPLEFKAGVTVTVSLSDLRQVEGFESMTDVYLIGFHKPKGAA